MRVEPILDDPDMPFYVKLRAEAERSLLGDDKGKLYLGFFLDPLYEVHWNNLVDAIHFELDLPEAVSATPSSEHGPDVDVDADADPREFLIDVEGSSDAPIEATVHYFACDDAETFCVPVTQHYNVFLERDPDGGRRMTGARGGMMQRFLERDADGDGRISREEVPERMRSRFDRMDANGDGFIEDEELQRMGRPMRGRGNPVERLRQMDVDGDGRLSRNEVPEPMARRFDRMDANGDGYIDQDELEAMAERKRRRRPN